MKKINIDIKKTFIPHPMQLFIIGTTKNDFTSNLGIFSWVNFCWDEELSISLCLDGNKLTKERIISNKIFSLNMVTEEMLPYIEELIKISDDKKLISEKILLGRGEILDVPILENSPLVYELEMKKTIMLNGSTIFICKIRNTLIAENMVTKEKEYNLKDISPVIVALNSFYKLITERELGTWK